jgi:hypothetical protein
MTRKPTVENLLDQILSLSDEAQTEIVQALIESRAEDAGIYCADEDQQAILEVGRG